jgi:hypothetical protein
MGRLITQGDIQNPCWYFEDAYYTRNGGRDGYDYKWPNPSFPYQVAIYYKHLEGNKTKIEIRRWIELNINDTVISNTINKSYEVYYGDEEIRDGDREPYDFWDKHYDVEHRWMVFHFEDEHSALAFRLRFSDIVSEITERKPDHLDKITRDSRY